MRVVSLVPSLTDAVDQLGRGETLVGVTDWCTDGAPAEAVRIGGTKNPDTDAVLALRPDVVLANTEENRAPDLALLRDAGVTVEEVYPKTVADAAAMVRRLGLVLGAESAATPIAEAIDAELAVGVTTARPRVMALTLIWRKPWMAVGPGTYADDLLWQSGFANVLSGFDTAYPRLEEGLMLGADVVLLPSEPYEFSGEDLPAVGDLVGADVHAELIDGQALTWHGPRTMEALRTFRRLADRLADALDA